jgi:hypothetical protein
MLVSELRDIIIPTARAAPGEPALKATSLYVKVFPSGISRTIVFTNLLKERTRFII